MLTIDLYGLKSLWSKFILFETFVYIFEWVTKFSTHELNILRPEEFESYKIGESTTITFCMRELRAILNFAESMNVNITANFDIAGR